MNGGGRGRGGFGNSGGGGGRSGNQNSVFVGNLDYNLDQDAISRMLGAQGINPVGVRLLKDDQGRSRGSAFCDFASSADADNACGLDGKSLGGNKRALRINKA